MNKIAALLIAAAIVGLAGMWYRKPPTSPKPGPDYTPKPSGLVPAWYQHHQQLHERLVRVVASQQSANH
mgnify:CR=1 FL=1